jgi:uncharacterized membrane protein
MDTNNSNPMYEPVEEEKQTLYEEKPLLDEENQTLYEEKPLLDEENQALRDELENIQRRRPSFITTVIESCLFTVIIYAVIVLSTPMPPVHRGWSWTGGGIGFFGQIGYFAYVVLKALWTIPRSSLLSAPGLLRRRVVGTSIAVGTLFISVTLIAILAVARRNGVP